MQQWKTQVNKPPILETSHKIKNVLEKNIKRYYQEQSQIVQIVRKADKTATGLSKVSATLPLKWLRDKPMWMEQWPLKLEKLLEKLVQNELNP